MRVVYFGTPQFAAEILKALLSHRGIEVAAVVTKPDKALGRSSALVPTPVKAVALAHLPPIPVHQPEIVSAPDVAPLLAAYEADLFVVVAYGEILKQHILDMPKVACINVHPSLLPKYRGATPIQSALLNGDTETGVTIMHMAKKMDAGDIIAVEKVAVGPDTTFGELESTLCQASANLLIKTLEAFRTGHAGRTPQDHQLATFCKKIEPEDCRVDWSRPAEELHNLIRALTPNPGAWCTVSLRGESKRLRILASTVDSKPCTAPPGTLVSSPKDGLVIACDGGALKLLKVQLEGKKAMDAAEFMRGIPQGMLAVC